MDEVELGQVVLLFGLHNDAFSVLGVIMPKEMQCRVNH